jgi:polyketide biosynthesis acyl carrier protein
MTDQAATAELLRAVVGRIVPGAELAPGKHLRDIGADSVDRVEIIVEVLDRLGLDTPLSAFSDLPDIAALIDLLTVLGNR